MSTFSDLPLPAALTLLAIGLLASLGMVRWLELLRPLLPLARSVPRLAWRAGRDAASSGWAWARLPVRIQLVWPALLAGLATSPFTALLSPTLAFSELSQRFRLKTPWQGPPTGFTELEVLAQRAPLLTYGVLFLAVLGALRAFRLSARSGVARWFWRAVRWLWRWSDRVSRRLLTFPLTLPLGLLAALVVAALTGLPTLARTTPGGVTVAAVLLVMRAAYAASLARRGRKLVFDGGIRVDDVSRMSGTAVERVVGVLDADDVVSAVQGAIRDGLQVSVRGKSHTMGGQTLARGGVVLDTRFLRRVRWDPARELVWAEAGATWGEVIRVLNRYARAPMTMQSYCSFSVGGTLSANAHGITNDFAMISSVESLVLVDAEGVLRTCSRTEDPERFAHVLGGYGLFGVLVGAWLRVVENHKLAMEMTSLPPERFRSVYEPLLLDGTVEVKLARIDVTTFDQLFVYVFRRSAHEPTVSELGATAREMSVASRLLYTWAMPLAAARRLRSAIEDALQRPVDWSGESDRNVLMYESAAPLARLYAPLNLDETFVLQEFFVPPDAFVAFLDQIRPVLKTGRPGVTLLNLTIRFVRTDTESALPYAQRDVYALVLYYRLARSADQALSELHAGLASAALALGGTFYLPYRHHYSDVQLAQGHPRFPAFVEAKWRMDPEYRFSNAWFRRYAGGVRPNPVARPVPATERPLRPVEVHRFDSFRRCIAEPELRHRFDAFLEHTFPIEDPRRILAIVSQEVAHRPDDGSVYAGLVRRRMERPFPALFEARNALRQVFELRRQNTELLRQVQELLLLAGRRGPIRGLASIGDPGRLVTGLQALGVRGDVYVVHDQARPLDVIERGSLFAVGTAVPIDYRHVDELAIPSASVDLVTMMQGLHHFPVERLPAFLAIVRRILRPGGLFVFREHDARPEVMPILDVAHSVFNAVTGVSVEDEAAEIRAFRPIADWRALLAEAGFEDLGPLEGEDLDPTDDLMLGFRRPLEAVAADERHETVGSVDTLERAKAVLARRGVELAQVGPLFTFFRMPEWMLVDLAQEFGRSLDEVPWYRFPFVRMVWLYWRLLDAELRAAARVGGAEALVSAGLWMDVVIGVVTTIQFLSMKLLALPILWMYGTEPVAEFEQLLVLPGPDPLPELRGCRVHAPAEGVVLVESPRHRPFTETVRALAALEGCELLEIGGHRGPVQLRVRCTHEAALAPLRDWPQLEVIATWRFPVDGAPFEAALVVPVPRLLETVRRLARNPDVRLAQVFDWS